MAKPIIVNGLQTMGLMGFTTHPAFPGFRLESCRNDSKGGDRPVGWAVPTNGSIKPQTAGTARSTLAVSLLECIRQ